MWGETLLPWAGPRGGMAQLASLSPAPRPWPRMQLNTLNEYVEDTEDYINIVLDTRRNQLIQFQARPSPEIGLLIRGAFRHRPSLTRRSAV